MEEELLNFVLEIESLSTMEFCEKYKVPVPSWKGNIDKAAGEFLALDATKYTLIKNKAKDIFKAKRDK